jgi:peptidoglycan LD-endopeptidase LytH
MRYRNVTLVVFVILVALGAVFLFALPLFRHPLVAYSLVRQSAPPHLPVPVLGVTPAQLVDSWGSPRSGGRHHQGIDIFAKKDQPVLSATPGIVMTVGTNSLGGRIVKVIGPGLEWHYYAHLDRYGIFHPGDIVRAGDVVGYVGDTGNAKGTPFHLHYGIYSRIGVARNPYPRLTGRFIAPAAVPKSRSPLSALPLRTRSVFHPGTSSASAPTQSST